MMKIRQHFPKSFLYTTMHRTMYSHFCKNASSTSIKTIKKTGSIEPIDLSFSGCGFLIPYHLGVTKVLKEEGYITEKSKFAGASGGAIVATVLGLGIDLDEFMKWVKSLSEECRKSGTMWKLENALRKELNDKLPENAHELANANQVAIAATEIYPTPRISIINHYFSRRDLIEAIVTSSYIPFYMGTSPAIWFRGNLAVDGGLIKIVPEIQGYQKISAFQQDIMKIQDCIISPTILKHQFPYSFSQLVWFALNPPTACVLHQLFQLGEQSAHIWVQQQQQQQQSQQSQQ